VTEFRHMRIFIVLVIFIDRSGVLTL